MYASSGPNHETVALLLARGATVNLRDTEERFTALMFAASEGQDKVVRLLLEHGADPSLVDADGDTALTFAKQNGHRAVVAILTAALSPGA
jgi:ankyrin repeat protein